MKCAIAGCDNPAEYISYGTSLCERCLELMENAKREDVPLSIEGIEQMKSRVEGQVNAGPTNTWAESDDRPR